MTLKEKIELAWKNKGAIAEGFYNNYISMSDDIRIEAARRLTICSSNQCGYYDAHGRPENAVIPGKPSCSICKCNMVIKCHSMESSCPLDRVGKTPLWEAVISEEQDKDIKDVQYKKQFEKK